MLLYYIRKWIGYRIYKILRIDGRYNIHAVPVPMDRTSILMLAFMLPTLLLFIGFMCCGILDYITAVFNSVSASEVVNPFFAGHFGTLLLLCIVFSEFLIFLFLMLLVSIKVHSKKKKMFDILSFCFLIVFIGCLYLYFLASLYYHVNYYPEGTPFIYWDDAYVWGRIPDFVAFIIIISIYTIYKEKKRTKKLRSVSHVKDGVEA